MRSARLQTDSALCSFSVLIEDSWSVTKINKEIPYRGRSTP